MNGLMDVMNSIGYWVCSPKGVFHHACKLDDLLISRTLGMMNSISHSMYSTYFIIKRYDTPTALRSNNSNGSNRRPRRLGVPRRPWLRINQIVGALLQYSNF